MAHEEYDLQIYPAVIPNQNPNQLSITSLFYNLSLLKEKTQQIQSQLSLLISSVHLLESTSISTLIQEIAFIASSMMFTCQQMTIVAPGTKPNLSVVQIENEKYIQNNTSCATNTNGQPPESGLYMDAITIEDHSYNTNNENSNGDNNVMINCSSNDYTTTVRVESSSRHQEIIELKAADLLAKYTHYCQICGKGFKRDANMRMHMRAHGEEYKTITALLNPRKNIDNNNNNELRLRYSCPHDGCRWNQKHQRFQPLKSIVCVKNHYKRSHCPKMYICKRCDKKRFSVLSDLRTHEKHCGDIMKWVCSCGTMFSRKDKLISHVGLFTGHSPAVDLGINRGDIEMAVNRSQLENM